MKTIQLSNASRPLAEYARELKDDILVVKDASGPVAAVVPLKAVDEESLALSAHPVPRRKAKKKLLPPARKARRD